MKVSKDRARDAIEKVAYNGMIHILGCDVDDPDHEHNLEEDPEDVRKRAMTHVLSVMFLYRSDPEMWKGILDVSPDVSAAALALADEANAELRETLVD